MVWFLVKQSAKWIFLRVIVPFLFVALFFAIDAEGANASLDQTVSTIGFLWWGFGVGVFGVKELFDALKYDWKRPKVKAFIATLLIFLYFSATVHAVMIFCGASVSVNQNFPVPYIISPLVVILSLVAHCVLRALAYEGSTS